MAYPRYAALGASSRIRWLQFLPELRRLGLDIDVSPLLDDEYLRRKYAGRPTPVAIARAYAGRAAVVLARRDSADVVWIEKELWPWAPAWLERLAWGRRPVVLDYDDAVFHSYDLHRSGLVRALFGGKIDRLMRGAAMVVAGNDYLAQRARQAGAPRVELLPTVSILMALSIAGGAFTARAADMATRQVTEALVKASRNDPADFSGLDLSYLDLSTLDFKGANLSDADLYGTDFTSANLSNANLSHTRLDRAVLIRADLSGARLDGASILRPTAFADMRFNHADAPSFKGASMIGVRIQAKLDGADFSHADLSNADFSPYEDRAGEGTITTVPRNELSNAKFNAANLTKANFSRAVVKFAEFRDANLTGVSGMFIFRFVLAYRSGAWWLT